MKLTRNEINSNIILLRVFLLSLCTNESKNNKKRVLFFNFSSLFPLNFFEYLKKYLILQNHTIKRFLHQDNDNDHMAYAMYNNLFDLDVHEKQQHIYLGNYEYSKETFSDLLTVINDQHNEYVLFVDYATIQELKKMKIGTLCNVNDLFTSRDEHLLTTFYGQSESFFIHELLHHKSEWSIEQLSYYMRFAPLTKKSSWKDTIQYIESGDGALLHYPYSLFDFMTYFFQKDKDKFFSLWKIIRQAYTNEFLFYYVMDQLWLAYTFCYVRDHGHPMNESDNKKLCWWFAKGGHKKYTPESFIDSMYCLNDYYVQEKVHNIDMKIFEKVFFDWFN